MEESSRVEDSRGRIAVRPTMVAGVRQACLLLDGVWEFTMDRWPGVPVPASLSWLPVNVPGELAMQGFDIENGTEYYYRRTVSVPADFQDKAIAVRFESVHSDARVWMNGTMVGSHRSPATIWECDVSSVVRPGEAAVLVVGVRDDLLDPSILSLYAGHNTGGILRSVSLLARHRTHVCMLHVDAGLDADGRTGRLAIEAAVAQPGKQTALQFQVQGPSGLPRPAFPPQPVGAGDRVRFQVPVEDVAGWDTEHPRLYQLRCVLQEGGAALEEYTLQIGFRHITFGGADGTDPRKVLVNGQPIKLRGVCLHDWSLKSGRCTTPEQNRSDVARLRECNVNYIRTSHYPPPMTLVEECDRQGIYLEIETALCFQHGILGTEQSADYLSRFIEMVEACRNHPSVLIWSLGNESSWNDGTGAEYDWVKRNEPTRPAKFSWPQTIFEEHAPMDLFSVHYVHFEDGLNATHTVAAGERPYLHDEIAHVPCNNVVELRRDPNVHNAWGESIRRHWNEIYETEGALGAAVWEARDDVFFLPPGVTARRTTVFNDVNSTAAWGCVWDSADVIKPEAWLLKNAYSPILIEERRLVSGVPVANRFLHTRFSEITAEWQSARGSGPLSLPDLGPGESGMITIPEKIITGTNRVTLRFYDQGRLMLYEHVLALKGRGRPPRPTGRARPEIATTGSSLLLRAGSTELELDKATGVIVGLRSDGETLLAGGPHLHLTGVSTGPWRIDQGSLVTARRRSSVSVRMSGTFPAARVTFAITLSDREDVGFSFLLPEEPRDDRELSEAGVSFVLPLSVETIGWQRDGPWTAYPDDHIGRNEGVARRSVPGADTDRFGLPGAAPWKDSTRDYALFRRNDVHDGLATRDFRAMKEHVRRVTLEYAGLRRGLEIFPEGDQACRIAYGRGRDPLVHASDGDIVYGGPWRRVPLIGYNGATWVSTQAGSSATLRFIGTGVAVHGLRQQGSALMRVLIDGVPVAMIDPATGSTAERAVVMLFRSAVLAPGEHTVRVVVADSHGGELGITLFEILQGTPPPLSARLIFNRLWGYPQMDWGNHGRPPARLFKGLARLAPPAAVSPGYSTIPVKRL